MNFQLDPEIELLQASIRESMRTDQYVQLITILEILDRLEVKESAEVIEMDHTKCLPEMKYILR